MQTSWQLTKSSGPVSFFLCFFFALKLGVVDVLRDVDDADVAAVIPLTTSTTTSVGFFSLSLSLFLSHTLAYNKSFRPFSTSAISHSHFISYAFALIAFIDAFYE